MLRLALLLLVLSLAGCSDRSADPADVREAFAVRGVYLGPAYDGAAAVIDHEAIPGVMTAMRMPFRLADPGDLDDVEVGDKIRFRLADTGGGYRIDSIAVLSPGTPLALAEVGADAVPPEESLGGQ